MIESGEQAPEFTLPDQDGNPVALSALRGRRVVLVGEQREVQRLLAVELLHRAHRVG